MEWQLGVALLDRIQVHRESGRATDLASDIYRQPIAHYTDPARLAKERALLRSTPIVVGMSGLVGEPNVPVDVSIGNDAVLLQRDSDGTLSATSLRSPGDAERVAIPVRESDGLIWANLDPEGEVHDDPLHGAGQEIAGLDLASHEFFVSRTIVRPVNWKLVVDTFLEVYHVAILHRDTIDPLIFSRFCAYDPFGFHGRLVVPRRTISEIDSQPRQEWDLIRHATIIWLLQPNAILIYQQDHAQLFQAWPGSSIDEAIITVSQYNSPRTERSDRTWGKNFELLLTVTDEEDFGICAGMQSSFRARAKEHLMFGRNEPMLAHYHRELDEMLDALH